MSTQTPSSAAQDAIRSSLEVAQRVAQESLDASSDAARKIQEAVQAVGERVRGRDGEDARAAAQDAIAACIEVAKRIANESFEAGTDAARDVQEALEAALDAVRRRASTDGRGSNFEDWSRDDLYERAQELGIEGRSDMTKEDLVSALRKAS